MTRKNTTRSNYNDIKPNEQDTVSVNNNHNKVLFASFEEWAMLILKPPLQTRLDLAIAANDDTRRRWNTCEAKLSSDYRFEFNDKDYSNKKRKIKMKNRRIKTTSLHQSTMTKQTKRFIWPSLKD